METLYCDEVLTPVAEYSGTYGVVVTDFSKNLAVKKIERKNFKYCDSEFLIIRLLNGTKHNIQCYCGCCDLQATRGDCFTISDTHVLIKMELMNGGALTQMHTKSLNEQQKNKCILEIGLGLQELHNLNIIHRDLQSANILWRDCGDNVYTYKIADYGLSKSPISYLPKDERVNMIFGKLKIKNSDHAEQIHTSGMCQVLYRAPEVFGDTYSLSADIWSYGCLMYFIKKGCHLFSVLQDGTSEHQDAFTALQISLLCYSTVIDGDLTISDSVFSKFPTNIKDILYNACKMRISPCIGETVTYRFNRPFIQETRKYINRDPIILQCLQADAGKRLNIGKILNLLQSDSSRKRKPSIEHPQMKKLKL